MRKAFNKSIHGGRSLPSLAALLTICWAWGVGREQLEPRNANLFLQKETVGLRREACVRTATEEYREGEKEKVEGDTP